MKCSLATLSLGLVGLAHSLDLSAYVAGQGVEPQFKDFLGKLYLSTEDPAVTTGFSDFFTPDGQLIVRGIVATGADEIIALKQKLLPPAGNKHWNHRPNETTVYSDTDAQKVYQVLGIIESTYDGGNCSQAYYSTRFTVEKEADGGIIFEADVGNLVKYDDYVIEPSVSPTDIACGA